MADVSPFRALRYDASRVDPAFAIAPPYDVISPAQQASLYERSPHNVVRLEYGEQRNDDSPSRNRYTRAHDDLAGWIGSGALARDAVPALYAYRQEFSWARRTYARSAVFGVVRLEEWAKGIIRPHEHTLAGPKTDRLELLRATRTQISPVYCLYRARKPSAVTLNGDILYDFTADGQRHVIRAVTKKSEVTSFKDLIKASDVYIADGHHRYETALAYRDEVRARADRWTGYEAENFVLMALTDITDTGLLVLPTHRLVHRSFSARSWRTIERCFDVEAIAPGEMLARLGERGAEDTCFVALTAAGGARMVSLRDRAGVEAAMPEGQPPEWKRLDVNVLQYGILAPALGISEAELAMGGVVTYTQDAAEASIAVSRGDAQAAFLLNATPVEQVLAVADAGGRMPQKSTYFYPKLPTGLVMNALD